jgi:hypothetical protein
VAKTTLRIRFSLSRTAGAKPQTEFKRGADRFATTVVRQVGTEYAKGEFFELKDKIQSQIAVAVQREIANMVQQYKRFIVGKTQTAGRGTLTTATRGSGFTIGGNRTAADSVSLSSALPKWADRKPDYLRRKQRDIGHKRWFEYSGYLGAQMTPEAWEEFFGPIRVSVQPIQSRDVGEGPLVDTGTRFRTGDASGKTQRFGVANISVSVFGKLTPAMLPALANGDMSGSLLGDGRRNGLLGLIGGTNPELAYHLGSNPAYTPYRPGLEPFLAFVVTRAAPAQIFNRLSADGFTASSAGRTR